MVRLKNLLLEDEKKFLSLLRKNFKSGLKTLLYRGSDDTFSGSYDVKNIRKNRKPRGTPAKTHHFIEVVSKKRNFGILRSESKFATPDPGEAELYGSNIYIVFPAKNAKIVSMDDDPTMEHFSWIGWGVKKAENEVAGENKFANEFPSLYQFLQHYTGRDPIKIEDWVDFLQKNWNSIKKELEKFLKDDSYYDAKNYLSTFYENLNGYFDDLKDGVKDFEGDPADVKTMPPKEVFFNGDSYLRVKREWFKSNFKFENGWKLK